MGDQTAQGVFLRFLILIRINSSKVRFDVVPAHLEDQVRKAAKECAPGAIIVEE